MESSNTQLKFEMPIDQTIQLLCTILYAYLRWLLRQNTFIARSTLQPEIKWHR